MNSNSNKSLYIKSCFYNNDLTFEGLILSTATGFLVKYKEKVFLVTNRHVVTGKNLYTGENLDKDNGALPNCIVVEFPYEVETSDKGDTFWSNPFRLKLYKDDDFIDENRLWLEHPLYKEKVDVVAIDVTEIYNNSINILQSLRNYKNVDIPLYENIGNIPCIPKVTDKVFVVGYPYGYSTTVKRYLPIWSSANIASEYEENLTMPINYTDKMHEIHNKIVSEEDSKKREELNKELCKINNYEVPTFLIDSKTRGGQSGSPVLFESPIKSEKKEYHLIGIYSGRVNASSDLGYVWKIEVIKEILENGV